MHQLQRVLDLGLGRAFRGHRMQRSVGDHVVRGEMHRLVEVGNLVLYHRRSLRSVAILRQRFARQQDARQRLFDDGAAQFDRFTPDRDFRLVGFIGLFAGRGDIRTRHRIFRLRNAAPTTTPTPTPTSTTLCISLGTFRSGLARAGVRRRSHTFRSHDSFRHGSRGGGYRLLLPIAIPVPVSSAIPIAASALTSTVAPTFAATLASAFSRFARRPAAFLARHMVDVFRMLVHEVGDIEERVPL